MDRTTKHNKAMAKQKAAVDEGIAKADTERGVSVLLTGDGKGKTSSAFGMVIRARGYNQKVGIVQFIKGAHVEVQRGDTVAESLGDSVVGNHD